MEFIRFLQERSDFQETLYALFPGDKSPFDTRHDRHDTEAGSPGSDHIIPSGNILTGKTAVRLRSLPIITEVRFLYHIQQLLVRHWIGSGRDCLGIIGFIQRIIHGRHLIISLFTNLSQEISITIHPRAADSDRLVSDPVERTVNAIVFYILLRLRNPFDIDMTLIRLGFLQDRSV